MKPYPDAILKADRSGRATSLRKLPATADEPERLAVVFDGVDLVTFYADGRIKIRTNGRNDQPTIERVNDFLPYPYRLYKPKRGSNVRLEEGRRIVATFLSSTIFAPASPLSNARQLEGLKV